MLNELLHIGYASINNIPNKNGEGSIVQRSVQWCNHDQVIVNSNGLFFKP